jgi:hypothetical protein
VPKKPQLTVVNLQRSVPDPPPELGQHGGALWREIHQQYDLVDAGGIETLRQACLGCDRAEACRRIIDEQGEMLVVRGQVRSHPLLRDELQNRSFVTRAIARLGLDLEPVRDRIGRPSGSR